MNDLLFRPITPEAREEITSFTLHSYGQICDLAFANLYGWAVKYETSYCISDETLFIRFTSPQRAHPAYLVPILREEGCVSQAILRLKETAEAGNYPLVLMGVTPLCRERLEAFCPHAFTFLESEGNADYIYLREKLVTLSGKALQSKRNHVNKFEKSYDYTFEPITGENAMECMALEQTWLREHGSEADGEDKEEEVIHRLLTHFEELQLSGGILRVEG